MCGYLLLHLMNFSNGGGKLRQIKFNGGKMTPSPPEINPVIVGE